MFVSVFHVSKDNEIHDGLLDACKKCRKARRCGTPKQVSTRNGRLGGKLLHEELSKDTSKRCRCGKFISTHNNKTGLCRTCYKKSRLKGPRLKKQVEIRICAREGCGRQLDPSNKTGYCAKCWRDSPRGKELLQDHTAWVAVNVYKQDVKTWDLENRVAGSA